MPPVAPAPAVRERRIDYIDGLRAVAVLSVIVHHLASHGALTGPGAPIALEGAHGVDLFFVLSGFCLAFPTLARLRRGEGVSFDTVAFAAKRVVRIVPPFYLATALFVVLFIAIPALRHPGRPAFWTFGDIAAPLLFLDGQASLINGSFWTLMVEFRWYFAFPLLLELWIRSPRAFIAVGAASAIVYHFTRARGLDFGTLPGFMLGIIAADLFARPERFAGWGTYARRFALPLAAPCALLGILSEPTATIPGLVGEANIRYAYQPTLLGWQLAMFFVVVAAGEIAVLRQLLSLRALAAVGVASYGIYLVHEPIVDLASKRLHGPAGVLGAFVIAVAAGFAFWAVAERPFTGGPIRAMLVQRARLAIAGIFAFFALPPVIRVGSVRSAAVAPEPAAGLPQVPVTVDLR